MNTEQKLVALNALAECRLLMRKPGDWYVCQSAEIKEGSLLTSYFGNGRTPFEAIDNHWDEVAGRSSYSTPIVINAGNELRREVFWNGFMWHEKPLAIGEE